MRFEGRKRIPQRLHTSPPKGPRRLALPSRRMGRLQDARWGLRDGVSRTLQGTRELESPRPGNRGGAGKPRRSAIPREQSRGGRGQPEGPQPGAPPAPQRERESPAEVLRRALPGVVWPPPPRVSGLPAAAAVASGPGGRSDVTAMAGIKGGLGALGGQRAARPPRERGRGSTQAPHAASRGRARAAGPLRWRQSPDPRPQPPACALGAEVGAAASGKGRRGRRLVRQPPLSAELGSLAPTRRAPYGERSGPRGVRSPAAARAITHVLQEFASESEAGRGWF